MTHLDRPHHQVTAIADGARDHTQREMKTARDVAQRFRQGAVCKDNEAPAHPGAVRDPVDGRGLARDDMDMGSAGFP